MKKEDQLDLKLRLQFAEPIEVEDFGKIYPLTLKEIVSYGYNEYLTCLNMICLSVSDFIKDDVDHSEIEGLTLIDFVLAIGDDELKEFLKKALSLFMGGKVRFDKEKLCAYVMREDKTLVVTNSNFNEICDIIKWQNHIKTFSKEEESFNPANEEVRKFKERTEKMKKKVEQAKKKKESNSGDKDDAEIDFSDIIESVCAMSNLNEYEIQNLTVYQLYRKYKRLQKIDEYDIAIKSMMAGAKNVKLSHWSSSVD